MTKRLAAAVTLGWLTAGTLCAAASGAPLPRTFTLAGNGGFTIGHAGGPREGARADRVEFHVPQDLALAPDDSILYVDGITGAVRRVGVDGRVRTLLSSDLDGHRRPGPTVEATAITTVADGRVLVAEYGDVVRVGRDRTLHRVAGNAKEGSDGDGGRATDASLGGVGALAPMPDGSLLVLETMGNRIRRVRADGIIEPAAGTGETGFSGDGGPATQATFHLADEEGIGGDVAALPDGGFLIADSANNRVRRVWPNGLVSTVAGDGRPMSRGDGGPATAASLNDPEAVAATPDGGFVVSDVFGHRLRSVRPDGTITTLAGNGNRAPEGDGAPVGDGGRAIDAFVEPWGGGLLSTSDGSVLFTDFTRIHLVSPTPTVLTAVAVTGVRTAADANVIEYRSTVPGSIHVVVRSEDGRTVASRRARSPAGHGQFRVSRRLPPAVYRVTATLATAKRTTEATTGLVIAPALPLPIAERAITQELATANAALGLSSGVRACARLAAGRIDCDAVVAGTCDHEAAATLSRGVVSVRDYRCARRHVRRRFTLRPDWTSEPTPQAVLGSAPQPVG